MMSLNEISFSQIVLNQVKWKMKAYSQSIIILILIQITVSILFSGGNITMGGGFNEVNINIHYYTLDSYIILSCIWALVIAILMQTNGYRHDDYAVITTRYTASLANVIVLFVYSFIATIISFMTLYILIALIQVVGNIAVMKEYTLFEFVHFGLAFFIILLAASIGYLIGSIFKLSKGLGILMVVLAVIFTAILNVQPEALLVNFFFNTGYLSFMLKALFTCILLFVSSIFILSRKEVNRR
ncbi:hypothetical protein ACH0B5_09305 [Ureibacillus sp. 179-F W5.1 NHS]|nr:hypothetical protein [Lysinibacillus halotolerans]